ncbi:MAG: PQQ-binding-like beta-propeller repeat protein [Kutzneria sp.]|nr:PQQ-binding-like beta-propeller repeat protein [Kutzneria sp.]
MRRVLGVLVGVGAVVAACAPSTTVQPAEHAASEDWPTYHRDNQRSGTATMPPVSAPSQAWHTKLDGAVYGQPLMVGGRLLAATENDTVYALDPDTGAVQWSDNLGTPMPRADLPCGNIDPLGITSTMAYDPDSGRVYALAETGGGNHTLVGISAKTGAVEVTTTVEPPSGTPIAHQQRSALTVTNGRVNIAYGGLFGDCGDYVGSVVSVRTDGTDRHDYAVPTSREAGIWAPGGAVEAAGRLLYSVGNGESTTTYDGSDSVIALAADRLDQVDVFTPSTWVDDNAHDIDLGSSSPVLVGGYVVITGKRGVAYVMKSDKLAELVSSLTICPSYGGAAVDAGTIFMPCRGAGPKAVAVDGTGTLSVRWTSPVKAPGSPTVGGGAVWVVDYDGGTLYALDEQSGAVRGQLSIGRAPHFASPTLSGPRAYVGTMDGVVGINGA